MFDTVIKGGTEVDGTGATARTADVAIRDGHIVEIGRVTAPAERVIDAESDTSVDRRDITEVLANIFHRTHKVTFKFTEPVEYEPTPDQSIKPEAARLGKSSAEHMYDRLLEDGGKALFMILSSNYHSGDLEVCREMFLEPRTVAGNGDAGAHVSFISDCSVGHHPSPDALDA